MRPLPLMATLTAAASLSPKPRVLGVTGGIAMGKSTITSLLQNVYRIPFHDADQCVRRLYAKGGPAVAPVAAAFGDVLSEDGAIDRAKLGAKLTHLEGAARTKAFERLDAIVHPLVREERERFVRDQTCWLVGVDIPLLFETGAEGIDHTVAVSCGRDEQRRRALKREGMTPEKLDAILGRQLADEDRVARADFVVETDCYDKARARGQAAAVVEELWGAPSSVEAAPCRAMNYFVRERLRKQCSPALVGRRSVHLGSDNESPGLNAESRHSRPFTVMREVNSRRQGPVTVVATRAIQRANRAFVCTLLSHRVGIGLPALGGTVAADSNGGRTQESPKLEVAITCIKRRDGVGRVDTLSRPRQSVLGCAHAQLKARDGRPRRGHVHGVGVLSIKEELDIIRAVRKPELRHCVRRVAVEGEPCLRSVSGGFHQNEAVGTIVGPS